MEKDMNQYLSKAEVLIEALPYIQRFNRKIIVIKYGGSAMMNDELKKNVIADAVLLKLVGFKPIIVHGGGKEISRWVNKVGMEARFVNGLRVTDAPTMEIAEMVLNKVNKSLVQMVQELDSHPGVLRGDKVRLRQGLGHALGDVPQVADGRGYKIQGPRHTGHSSVTGKIERPGRPCFTASTTIP